MLAATPRSGLTYNPSLRAGQPGRAFAEHISLDVFAGQANTIPHETLTRSGERHTRRCMSAGSV